MIDDPLSAPQSHAHVGPYAEYAGTPIGLHAPNASAYPHRRGEGGNT